MVKFLDYLDSGISLEERLRWAFDEIHLPNEQREGIVAFLAPLKIKDQATYEHSIRVGILSRRIARIMHLDEKALLYAGLLHDVGKSQTNPETLKKTENWTPADTAEVKKHVMDGYRMVRGHFDFSAAIILWHHRFQWAKYPKHLPKSLHQYGEGTRALITMYGRILALADCYDALHRVNDKFGGSSLTGEKIREKMLELNRDQQLLINELYNAGVFTTYIATEGDSEKQLDEHDELYSQVWDLQQTTRTPDETARHVMLATALEPFSDKSGCTTRHRNLNSWQKIEYFVAGAINIGETFRSLANRVDYWSRQPALIYDRALLAQKDSKRNRRGGRVNQGIIELLMPIVVAQHVYDHKRELSVVQILEKATEVLKNTSAEDVKDLMKMKRFAQDLSGHFDRLVSDFPDARSVYEYYEKDLAGSTKPTSIAHNGEFVKGFPTVAIVCKVLCECRLPELNARVEEAYQMAASIHSREVGSGFLADCVAVGMYLQLSHDPRCKFVS